MSLPLCLGPSHYDLALFRGRFFGIKGRSVLDHPASFWPLREYLGLLGLSIPQGESKDIVLPVYFSVIRQGQGAVAISASTRPTFDLIEILRTAVEVPQERADAGLVITYPEFGLAV